MYMSDLEHGGLGASSTRSPKDSLTNVSKGTSSYTCTKTIRTKLLQERAKV